MRIETLSSLLGISLLSAAVAVAAVAPPQHRQGFEEEIDDSAWTELQPPSKEQAKRNLAMDKLLQGAWQLVEFEADDFEDYNRNDRGMLVFGPGFFSIEMHIVYESRDSLLDEVHFQSGSFRYRFDEEGQLVAKLSIGSAYDQQLRRMRFERAGSVRTFGLEVTESTLELTREPGGFRYQFTRLRSADRESLDVFGRPVLDDGANDSDFDPPNFEDPVEGDDPEDEEGERDGAFERAATPHREAPGIRAERS